MKFSKYVYLFSRDNEYFIYAPLSNSFAKLDKGVYDEILNSLNSDGCIKSLEEEIISQLRIMKVIDIDDVKELDKIKFNILSRRFNPLHLHLTINPTLACNFSCPYCFETKHSPRYMSDKIEDDIIQYIKCRNLARYLHVTWFGGEPLLAFDRIISLSERMMALGLKYRAGMITNGYLLSHDKICHFENLNILNVQITVDGSEDVHNSRRFLKSGGKTFKTIIENIDSAQRIAPKVHINVRVNIDPSNCEDFIKVYSFFKEHGYPNLTVYPGFVSDYSEKNKNHCVYNHKTIAEFLMNLYYQHGIYSPMFYPSSSLHTCAVRNPNAIVIGPNGELYKCWNDVGDEDRCYGYLNGNIINENILYEYLMGADHLNDTECNSCVFMPVCTGGCPYERIHNEKLGIAQSCSLFKENTDDFLWLQYLSKKRKLQ